ncbi:MAG TPA: glycosyltransferase [Actinomycetota bacterium]|nr:glycosyltransferase [Actinomycetota bacterium]
MAEVDILVPTYRRPTALAVTLAGVAAQTFRDFRLVVSDQTEDHPAWERPEVATVLRILRAGGRPVEVHRNLPRRGMAQQRQFLLDRTRGRACLFLDDDVFIEPDLLERLRAVLLEERCGFVGSAPIGASYLSDVRPHEWQLEVWEGPVLPERVEPGTPAWRRHLLHNAANVAHVAERLGAAKERPIRYKVAWVGGCVLFDTDALRAAGGFSFWRELPPEGHVGEDVEAQRRVLATAGGCGILPSGAYHLEVATTLPERVVDAPLVFSGRAGGYGSDGRSGNAETGPDPPTTSSRPLSARVRRSARSRSRSGGQRGSNRRSDADRGEEGVGRWEDPISGSRCSEGYPVRDRHRSGRG